jgi:hypothetical protein
MGGIRRRDTRVIGLLAGAAAATVIVLVLVVGLVGRGPVSPAPTAPVTAAPAVGPVVFYETVEAEGSTLYARSLDGRSLPRRVAVRTDVDYGPTWTVDPTARVAVAVVPADRDQALVGVDVASGATRWEIRTPPAPVDDAVWTTDGRRLAIASIAAGEGEVREVLVIDAATGALVRARIPDLAVIHGFDDGGAVVLRERVGDERSTRPVWRFLRLDPASGTVQQLPAPPDVPPASGLIDDVAPGSGLGVDTIQSETDGHVEIRVWPLAGGAPRVLADAPSIDRLAIDPAAGGVAFATAGVVRYVTWDGRTSDIVHGDDAIADFGWSASGDYIWVAADTRDGSVLTVIERATARAVQLPKTGRAPQMLLVRVLGGVPLPEPPLPASEPTPTPTAGPSGSDVAGFAGLLSSWVERGDDGHDRIHLERLVPTDGGGLRTAAEMTPIDLGPGGEDGGSVEPRIIPRPGSHDVLVWVVDGSRGWLWHGTGVSERLALPADWPTASDDIAWRADGRALAASAGVPTDAGEFEGVFAVAELGAARTTFVPLTGEYDRLEGWWSDAELRVGHGICSDGCGGRYATSARLRISDGRLRQMTPADRGRGTVDTVSWRGGDLVLSVVNDDRSDDIAIAWPAALGGPDTVDPIGFSADGRRLLVSRVDGEGVDVLALDDPVGGAVAGRVRDPRPMLIGRIAGRSLQLDVRPAGDWALVRDRVDDVGLVRLSDGRAWPAPRDRSFVWN